MTKPKHYATATDFRRALEERLKQQARLKGIDLQRLRRQVTFDRLLARLFSQKNTPWILKGGYAIELRLREARTTKDIDLTIKDLNWLTNAGAEDQNQIILDGLQEAASLDLGDFFVFLIGRSTSDLEAAPYGGARYPVEARMDGRTFVKFHLDVGVGDITMEPLDEINAPQWLSFAGIPSPRFRMISKEQQFAEKLHAYTLPRESLSNSRVKDLIDMIILINLGTMDKERMVIAIQATFNRRNTHAVPTTFSEPPGNWEKPFAALAKECKMNESITDTFSSLQSFLASLL